MGEQEGIAAFWRWWSEAGRRRVEAALDGGGVGGELIEDIGTRLGAVAPGLAWELAPGAQARHALVVSPEGDPELRATAHRLQRAAPAADAGFEYHSSRQADPSSLQMRLDVDGREFDLSELTAALSVDEEREEIGVRVHPGFSGSPERAQLQVAFMALDWLLGEEDVERWIGELEVTAEPPPDARPLVDLLAIVEERRAGRGEPRGVLVEYEDAEGRPVLVSAELPLKPVDHPLFDTHAALSTPFDAVREDGWPAPDGLTWLREREDELRDRLGEAAFLAAHETAGGRRTFHLYFDGTSSTEEDLRAWAAEALPAGAEVTVTRDAAWDAVRAFR